MKHLKRFDEELKPSTYQRAATKLDMQGHKSKNVEFTKRADALRSCGVSSHFGITMEFFQDVIKKITPNALMASVVSNV